MKVTKFCEFIKITGNFLFKFNQIEKVHKSENYQKAFNKIFILDLKKFFKRFLIFLR